MTATHEISYSLNSAKKPIDIVEKQYFDICNYVFFRNGWKNK